MKLKPTFHIFGASGLLGSALVRKCNEKNINVCQYSRTASGTNQFDLVSSDSKIVNQIRPIDFIVNLAAVSQPMLVSNNTQYAKSVNVYGNQRLHRIALLAGCKYFFMSSVEVFDGTEPALLEDTPKNPINEYGKQKASAEDYILNYGYSNYVIARTSWNVSSTNRGRCLVTFMIKALELDNAKMATDNIFTIASAQETAEIIVRSMLTDYRGIVHIASPKPVSRYEIAEIIIKSYSGRGLSCQPCFFKDLVFKEPRSRLNILDVTNSIQNLKAVYSDPESILLRRIAELNLALNSGMANV